MKTYLFSSHQIMTSLTKSGGIKVGHYKRYISEYLTISTLFLKHWTRCIFSVDTGNTHTHSLQSISPKQFENMNCKQEISALKLIITFKGYKNVCAPHPLCKLYQHVNYLRDQGGCPSLLVTNRAKTFLIMRRHIMNARNQMKKVIFLFLNYEKCSSISAVVFREQVSACRILPLAGAIQSFSAFVFTRRKFRIYVFGTWAMISDEKVLLR